MRIFRSGFSDLWGRNEIHGDQAFYDKLHCLYFPWHVFDDSFCQAFFFEKDSRNSPWQCDHSDRSGDSGFSMGA